jgi:PAS domain S-box-containing protein
MSGLKCEEELVGRSVLDFLPPGRLEEERKRLNSNLTNGNTTQFVEMNLQRPDGSHVEVEMASVPFRYRGKEYIQIVARGISDRKRYEETLLQQARLREQLSGLAEAVPGFLYTFRIEPDGSSGYPYASSGVRDLFGLGPEEIREDPAPLRARYHPDDLPVQCAAAADALRECKPFRNEIRIMNPDKGELWVEIRSTPQRRPDGATEWHGLMIDITERKRMEEMLAAREREFRSLAENMPDIIARYDQCGRTLYINPSFEKTIGMPLKDVLGKTSRECKRSDCFDEYADMMEHVAATGEVNTMELNVPDGNGGSKHYQINFVPECDQKGDIIDVLAIGRDITELRRSSQRILEKQKRLNDMALELSMAEDRERRRIATELHDILGQDLTLARMRLGGLTKIIAAEEQRKVIDEICYSIDNSIHHVRSLIWTINPPILESAGLEAALKWLGRQVEADYSLQVEFLDDLQVKPLPRECRMEIYNAVRELLINVAKHAGTDMALVSVCREEDNLTVRVKDEGIGFVPDIAANDPANDGFGLFNIQRRIHHLGGSFEIDSAPGKGARVTIRMPLADMRVEA